MAIEQALRFDGQRVVVTGAASGMGEAAARILGELGAEVHAVDVREPTVAVAQFHPTDLKSPAAIEATAAAITGGGAVDSLFNCAGIAQTFPPVDVMLVNFLGLRHLTEALLPSMPRGAAIACISSGAGIGYLANMATVMELLAINDHAKALEWCETHPTEIREGYSFSKECIIGYTMQRGMQVAREQGIRINCIGPGPTDTGMMPAIVSDMGQDYMDRFPKPLLGRNATAEEQAWPLVLLNTSVMGVVSGNVVWTDQGFAGGLFTGQIDISEIMPDM